MMKLRVIAAIALTACSCNKGEPDAEKTPAPAPAPKEDVRTAVPVDVTAGKLFTEYRTNQLGADAKYRDKVLRVTGIVQRVGRDGLDQPVVVFHLAARSSGLSAVFAAEAGLGDLRPQQVIAARCRCERLYADPELVDCVFEKALEE